MAHDSTNTVTAGPCDSDERITVWRDETDESPDTAWCVDLDGTYDTLRSLQAGLTQEAAEQYARDYADSHALRVEGKDGAADYVPEYTYEVLVEGVSPSERCDTVGAIDADVVVMGGGRDEHRWTGSVTLVPRAYDGELDMWGDLSHWLSDSLHDLPSDVREEIAAQAALAAKRADLV